jgi:hypothetical protein
MFLVNINICEYRKIPCKLHLKGRILISNSYIFFLIHLILQGVEIGPSTTSPESSVCWLRSTNQIYNLPLRLECLVYNNFMLLEH